MDQLPNRKDPLTSIDLVAAFKLQLLKDFEQSNFPADFVAGLEPGYDRIREQIALELQRNQSKADNSLMQLLYRIDISEGQLKKYLKQHETETYFNVIAELIIKRVLQKVVTKQYYRNLEG